MSLPGTIQAEADSCGVSLSLEQEEQIRSYLSLLSKWNQRVSLTSVEDPEELLRFHFLEAFWLAETFLEATKVLADVGSGAGFPGMAIQLYRPQLRVFLIEKNYKKSLFLSELSRDLSLPARVFQGFGESFHSWKNVDLAIMRALRPSARLLERLEKSGVSLLLLHGRKQPQFEGWQPVRQKRFPLSENRWATQFCRFT